MDAVYSPRTQTLSLIPLNSVPSSSSSSSLLCSFTVTRIHNEFLTGGHRHNLRHSRLQFRRKCRTVGVCTRNSQLQVVAALNPDQIVLIVSIAAVSAAFSVYLKFCHSKSKNKAEKVSDAGTSSSIDEIAKGGREVYPNQVLSFNALETKNMKEVKDVSYSVEGRETVPLLNGSKAAYSLNQEIVSDHDSATTKTALPVTILENQESGGENVKFSHNETASIHVDAVGLYDLPVSIFKDQEASGEEVQSLYQKTASAHENMNTGADFPACTSNDQESSSLPINNSFEKVEKQHASELGAVLSPLAVREVDESTSGSYPVETDLNFTLPVDQLDMKHATSVSLNDIPGLADNYKTTVNEVEPTDQGSRKLRREELHLFYESNESATEGSKQSSTVTSVSPEASVSNGHNVFTNIKSKSQDYTVAAGFSEKYRPTVSYKSSPSYETTDSRRGRGSSHVKEIDFPSQDDNKHLNHVSSNIVQHKRIKSSDPADFSSYNRLLRYGRLKECVEVLQDMDRKGVLDMNKVYHAKFFELCRKQNAVQEAFNFASLIRNPMLSTFNMLMSVCASARDIEGAFRVRELVHEAGFKADLKLYTTLISTCGKSGRVDAMFEVFNKMVNSGVVPNVHTYGALIDGCARAGQVAKAFGAYGMLRSKNVKADRVVFNALITACGQSGAIDRAFDVLTEMRSETHPVDPDHVTVGAMIKACTNAGQIHRVREVYQMMHRYKIKGTPEVYTIAVNSCSHAGDWEFACSIYDDMKKNGVVPDEMFFSALIDVAGHAGNLDAAFDVLLDARSQKDNWGIMSLSSLMGACCNTKNWQRALELYEDIKSMNLVPTVATMNALITALCDDKQLDKAMEVLPEMKKMGSCPNDITYSILLAACEKNDDIDTGLMLVSEAKINGVPMNLAMCKSIIGMCSRRFQKSSIAGEPVLSLKSGRPQIDSRWTSLALTIYRETIEAGIIPSMEVFSQVLGCLQIPNDANVRKSLTEALSVDSETSRSTNLMSLIEGFSVYDARAFSLLEEAASLGVVSVASFKDSHIIIDVRNLYVHAAQVYLLTVLKGLKHRLAAGAKLPSITILLPVDTTKMTSPEGEKVITLAGRISRAVGALLRRLRLSYQGNESHGKIKITGRAITKWFQPKLELDSHFSGKRQKLGFFESQLGKGIADQQRNIRTGNLSLY